MHTNELFEKNRSLGRRLAFVGGKKNVWPNYHITETIDGRQKKDESSPAYQKKLLQVTEISSETKLVIPLQ